MEASALRTASRSGLLGRRSPLLRLQGDERLVAAIRAGNAGAFEVLFERYHSRLLAFCRHMLRSAEDAEDVLQEVFFKAHAAMLADQRPINVRPWLYRIARNRCLNHLRRPVPDGQDSMDVLPHDGGTTTAERVQSREDFRSLVADVRDLPETQRTALLLREIDALSYEDISHAMDTTVPAVKSLLVRARISLAEASHSRQLTCGEVRLELAEAAEGLRKASGPVRHHLRRCEECHEFRGELRSNRRALASIAPLGPLALLHQTLVSKLGFGGSGSATAGGATGAGATTTAGGGAAAGGAAATAGSGAVAAAGGGSAALGGAAAAGASGLGGALGAKAAATAATAALLTAGAVEVRQIYSDTPADPAARSASAAAGTAERDTHAAPIEHRALPPAPATEAKPAPTASTPPVPAPAPVEDESVPAPVPVEEPAPAEEETPAEESVLGGAESGEGAVDEDQGASGSGREGLAVIVEPAEPEPEPAPAEPDSEPPPSGHSGSAPPPSASPLATGPAGSTTTQPGS